MRRIVGFAAAAAAAALAGCTQFGVFEDVGSDPHPPLLTVFTIERFVPPPPEPPPPPPGEEPPPEPPGASPRVTSWDSGGFTVRRGQRLLLWVVIEDPGGDVERITLRDRNGPLSIDVVPEDLVYYPSTATLVGLAQDGVEVTGMFGPHVLEVWAEDSHESRSEKVEVVVTFAP